MELSIILVSFSFLLFLVYFYLSWQYNYWRKRGIPSATGIIPGLGHMLPVISVRQGMGTLCEKFYKEAKNHSMYGFYHLCSPVLLIRDPELVKSVFLTNFASFSENMMKINCPKQDELLSLNPFFVNGEAWKKARAPLTNSFSSMKLKMLFPLIQKVGSKMTNYLNDKCKTGELELDLKDLCNKFTGEVASTGMGIEAYNFQEELQPKDNEMTYNQIVGKIFENPSITTGIVQMITFFMPSLARLFQVAIIPKEVDQYFRQISKSIISNRKNEKRNYNDFMQIALEYQKTHDSSLNEETLAAAHMLSFAADVYATSAVTISFLIFDLATHREIQDKLRQEIVTLFNKYNGILTYEALKEMTYLEKVLSESQRMNHAGGVFTKICIRDVKLEGADGLSCVVKAGQAVVVSAYGLQKDPKFWQDPENFDPERFSEEGKHNRHKFTFLPFGEGPRICVGMRMAMIMIKVAVCSILKDYYVEVSPKMVLPWERDEASFLNSPKDGDLKKPRQHSRGRETNFQVSVVGFGPVNEAQPPDEDRISYKENGCPVQAVDLVADCPLPTVTPPSSPFLSRFATLPRSSTPEGFLSMGQRSSSLLRPKISLTWVLRGQQQSSSTSPNNINSISPNSDQEHLSLETKDKSFRSSVKSVKSVRSIKSTKIVKEKDRGKENIGNFDNREIKHTVLHRIEKDPIEKIIEKERLNETPVDTMLESKLEKHVEVEKEMKEKVKRAISEPTLVPRESTLTSSGRDKHRHRRSKRPHKTRPPGRFGYEIADLDSFLMKASIEKPANIPVVLSFPSVLYQTQGGTQDEVALPLGTVVNAVFKNQSWLYVQTPHGQEGYVGYAACLPLGILPQPTHGPCWEDSTDVFPRPLGNMTDTEKLRDTRSECGTRGRSGRIKRSSRDAISTCGERSVDRLYLRAAANARTKGSRHTLLVIRNDYEGQGVNAISVNKGDVVALLSDHVNDWFWIRSRDGREGFIPAVIAGHGFL